MPDGGHFRLNREQAAKVIASASTQGYAHGLPLLRALAEGRIVVAFVERSATDLDVRWLDASGRPAVVVVQDDDLRSSGPDGFPVARKALRWGNWHFIHATGGQPEHYAFAVTMAEAYGRLVLVETAAQHAAAWADLARRAAMPRRVPGLVLVPRDGVHPVLPPTGARH